MSDDEDIKSGDAPDETQAQPVTGNAGEIPLDDLGKQGMSDDNPSDEEANLPGKNADGSPRGARDLEAVFDVPVRLSAVLGHLRMPVSEVLDLGSGAVLELDRKIGEAIDICVNDRLVARGEVVLVDEKLGVTMTEIIKTDR